MIFYLIKNYLKMMLRSASNILMYILAQIRSDPIEVISRRIMFHDAEIGIRKFKICMHCQGSVINHSLVV